MPKLALQSHDLKVLSALATNIAAGLLLSILAIKNLTVFITTTSVAALLIAISVTIERELEKLK